jgi:hypothetical protein
MPHRRRSRSLPSTFFGEGALPLLGPIMSLWNVWKNKKKAWQILHDVLASFPSVYQLMPPETEDYMFDNDTGQSLNPFADNVLDTAMVPLATRLHSEISDGVEKSCPIGPDKLAVIFGIGENTDVTYYTKKGSALGKASYELVGSKVAYLPCGDGTVTSQSASYRNRLVGKAALYQYDNVQHNDMCEDGRILQLLSTFI